MSFRTITGLVILLIGSMVIGWYFGGWGYSLFVKTVPAGAITELVRGATKGAYVSGGLLLGIIVFAWSVAVAWGSRFFRTSAKPAAASQPTAASAAR
jgi:hypothetical protein